MSAVWVRVCPVCDSENAPERAHCHNCGSLLGDVDFSRPQSVPGAAEVVDTPIPVAETSAPEAPESPASADEPIAAALNIPPLLLEEGGATAEESAPAPRICPDPDCGQPNPATATRCVYCDTPLDAVVPLPAPVVTDDQGGEDAPPPAEVGLVLEPFVLAADTPPSPEWTRQPSRVRLPQELVQRLTVIRELQVGGSESDVLIVESKAAGTIGERQVLKLYRPGLHPDSALLMRLAEAGSHVVKIYAHGVADGLAWELMEYCAAGNLREVLHNKLIGRSSFNRLVRELAAGVEAVHALNILHRDLKPENVLVRKREPLTLALTDFGIASLAEGTRHFTDTSRTVKYAAPEALTGVLDSKADWWSIGMMLLELSSGKHPFDNLSEQVVNHHLATRPIEISGVADEDIARLCRGLLLRDPGRRWGGKEVERWLAGDPELVAPVESGASLVRPYHLGEKKAYNAEELATMLAASAESWQEGARDLKRGLIQDWVKSELQDFNLARRLADIMEVRGEPIERKLLRFFLAVAPGLPPLWRGQVVTHKGLLQAAGVAYAFGTRVENAVMLRGGEAGASGGQQTTKNAQKAKEAALWLADVYDHDVLSLFARQGHQDLADLGREWRQTLAEIRTIWGEMHQNYRIFQRGPKARGGADQAVNFDQAVYGYDGTFNFPAWRLWYPVVVLALSRPTFLTAMEQEIERVSSEVVEDAPWFTHLMLLRAKEEASVAPAERIRHIARTLVAACLAGSARESAEDARKKRLRLQTERQKQIDEIRKSLALPLANFVDAEEIVDLEGARSMHAALVALHAKLEEINRLDYPDEAFVKLLSQLNALAHRANLLGDALDDMEGVLEMNGVFFRAEALRIGLLVWVILTVLVFAAGPKQLTALYYVLMGVGAVFILWRRRCRKVAQQAYLVRLRIFKHLCRNLLHNIEPE
jgi:serine/threonine protein kinase